MAVVIRMKRLGRKNRPSYRITVTDSAAPRDGRTLEMLGVYDPASPREELRLRLDVERARYWLRQGALPSETVRSILRREGAYEGFPEPKRRQRPGRKRVTASGRRRVERKRALAARKESRRTMRTAARRAAAKTTEAPA